MPGNNARSLLQQVFHHQVAEDPDSPTSRFGFVSYEMLFYPYIYDKSQKEIDATAWYMVLLMNKKSNQSFMDE